VNGWKRSYRRARFLLVRLLLLLAALPPRRVGLALFGRLAPILLVLRPNGRRRIRANLRRLHPDWSEARADRFARASVRALGRNAFDFARAARYSLAAIERLVAVEGYENLARARRPGMGVICLSAHLGCWELIPYRMRAFGHPVAVVYRSLRDPDLERLVTARRRRFGITTLERDRDARGILRSLRRGALLGILTDQATGIDSVRAPFLGIEAWSPTSAVRLAWHTGAPVVPMLITMGADGRHRLRIGAEIPLDPPAPGADAGARAAALVAAAARCNEAIGRGILAAPEQWVWFHDRWRE